MKVELNSRNFKISAAIASLFFLLGIVFAFGGILKHGPSLEHTSIVNISADIFCMFLGFILYICCVLDKQWDGENLNYFLLMIVTDYIAAMGDEYSWIVDGHPELRVYNIAINTLYYSTTPLLAYLFWRYVITFLNVERARSHKWDVIFRVGLVFSLVLILLNIPFGYYFAVGADGVYHREILYTIDLIYPFTVLILTMGLVVIARKRFKRHQIITLFVYAFCPLIVGVLGIFTYGLSLSSPVIMMVFLLMYCVLNVVQGKEKTVAEKELSMATAIQVNMLPRIFPPYPDRNEFDLFASMRPAKEVGGDFYDFFMIDDDHLCLVIADVSGKGIPAALYMMVAKTMIKNQALAGAGSPSAILKNVNDQLAENNTMDMFVTVWLGIMTISTGELICSNAGHEYPVFKKQGQKFELIKDKHAPPLGTMEGLKFKEYTLDFTKGDVLYVYTDGVAEATNRENELFGTDRMIAALNAASTDEPNVIERTVKEHIDQFIENAPQFDDITMLCIRYNGKLEER